jgi:hypothetical protein
VMGTDSVLDCAMTYRLAVARTGSFRFAERWESGWEVGSTRKVPGPKIKTEILSRAL